MTESNPEVEEWRIVPDHPDYQVSNRGRFRSHKRLIPQIMSPFTDKLGYVRLTMDGRRVMAHRIVASAWHGPCPDGKEVDHINRVRNDNRPENLRYLTRQQNMARMVPPPPPTHCPAKHPLSGDNLYIRPDGSHNCRTCSANGVRNLRLGGSGIPCTATGCDRNAYARIRTDTAVCEMHYQRERRVQKRALAHGSDTP